jgi:hypothetical protein
MRPWFSLRCDLPVDGPRCQRRRRENYPWAIGGSALPRIGRNTAIIFPQKIRGALILAADVLPVEQYAVTDRLYAGAGREYRRKNAAKVPSRSKNKFLDQSAQSPAKLQVSNVLVLSKGRLKTQAGRSSDAYRPSCAVD